MANLLASFGLIGLMSLSPYEMFQINLNVTLSLLCFFETLNFIHKQRGKQFTDEIFKRSNRAKFLAAIALGYAIVLPFNLHHSSFWRLLLSGLVFANLFTFNDESKEMIIYFINIGAVALILCAAILIGPSDTLFPGFFSWLMIECSLVLLERVVFSKKTK
jgi:hypothetical protein